MTCPVQGCVREYLHEGECDVPECDAAAPSSPPPVESYFKRYIEASQRADRAEAESARLKAEVERLTKDRDCWEDLNSENAQRANDAESRAAALARSLEEEEARHRYCHEHGECASYPSAPAAEGPKHAEWCVWDRGRPQVVCNCGASGRAPAAEGPKGAAT